MDRSRGPRWSDMSPQRRAGTVVMAVIQVTLAAAAWTDLARRPSDQVRGPKWRWALVIAVNFFGPLSYFRWGRTPQIGASAA